MTREAKSLGNTCKDETQVKIFMDRVHLHFSDQWCRHGPATARGYAYVGGKLLDARRLARFIASKRLDEILSVPMEANGLFAFVVTVGNSLLVAVDRIRSVPVFYAFTGNEIYASDDAYWVSEQLQEDRYDRLSVAEFLLTRYVTGNDTLCPRVKQLQAGEALLAEKTTEAIRVTTRRYYRYLHHDYLRESKDALIAELDAICVKAFERLVHSVNGRTIVVPLSGGYDSRLIAMMLRRSGYENVICYSYGIPGNWQSKVSEQVARTLRYQWEFVPYSHELWHDFFHSQECKSCLRYADGLTSVVLFQDWPAVLDMEKRRIIPRDGVFVPGHSGDFLAGSHIPIEFRRARRIGMGMVIQAIEGKHYNLWDLRKLELDLGDSGPSIVSACSELRKKIQSLCGDLPCETPQDAANVFECWDWQERQAKFIVNSVRGYEFQGHEWRLPLWDAELMSFWERIPFGQRLGKRLYNEYVEKVQTRLRVQQPSASGRVSPEHTGWLYLKTLLDAVGLLDHATKSGLVDLAGKTLVRINRSYKREYQGHPLAWYGIMSMRQFGSLYSRMPANVYSLLALERLGMVSF